MSSHKMGPLHCIAKSAGRHGCNQTHPVFRNFWNSSPNISDNYSGFVSELLTKVKDKLGIETKLSAPWHFQSHGDVERANRTIESMIRKYIEDSPRDWDENLHLLCFALRSVPHSGSKYSANYLVFGRPVRGLLDLEREGWEGEDTDNS